MTYEFHSGDKSISSGDIKNSDGETIFTASDVDYSQEVRDAIGNESGYIGDQPTGMIVDSGVHSPIPPVEGQIVIPGFSDGSSDEDVVPVAEQTEPSEEIKKIRKQVVLENLENDYDNLLNKSITWEEFLASRGHKPADFE